MLCVVVWLSNARCSPIPAFPSQRMSDTYLRIMRLHAAAGRTDAARRTYQLLLTRLREIDFTWPQPAIRQAAADLLGETGAQRGTTAPASAGRGW
jgi:hypothetical protein